MSNHYNKRHGSPYDRGAADSYYGRGKNPHYYLGATYSSPRVDALDMTVKELKEYHAGYENNEKEGSFKDWG